MTDYNRMFVPRTFQRLSAQDIDVFLSLRLHHLGRNGCQISFAFFAPTFTLQMKVQNLNVKSWFPVDLQECLSLLLALYLFQELLILCNVEDILNIVYLQENSH